MTTTSSSRSWTPTINSGNRVFTSDRDNVFAIRNLSIDRTRILVIIVPTSRKPVNPAKEDSVIVSRSLEQLKATRIVIAHRLSTVINADRIIVLQNGAIVQTGSYAELIAQEGPFAELAKRQIA